MDHFISYWPVYVAVALSLLFVCLYVKRGSVKGVFIGGRIRETIGNADGANALGFATLVTVHTLDSKDPSRAIALEITTKAATEFRWTPVTVSKRDAMKLAELLIEAASRPPN